MTRVRRIVKLAGLALGLATYLWFAAVRNAAARAGAEGAASRGTRSLTGS